MYFRVPAFHRIEIHKQLASGFDHGSQRSNGSLHIGRMLNDSKAEYFVELRRSKRQFIDAGLKKTQSHMGTIVSEIRLDGIGVINTVKVGCCLIEHNMRKPARAGAYFQHIFIGEVFLIPVRDRHKTPGTLIHTLGESVDLGFFKFVPLKAETGRIVVITHEPPCTTFTIKEVAFFVDQVISLWVQGCASGRVDQLNWVHFKKVKRGRPQ